MRHTHAWTEWTAWTAGAVLLHAAAIGILVVIFTAVEAASEREPDPTAQLTAGQAHRLALAPEEDN